jgi:hypothetical protein
LNYLKKYFNMAGRGRGQDLREYQGGGRPPGGQVGGRFARGNRGGRNGPGVERYPGRNNEILEHIKNNLFNALKQVCDIDLRTLGYEEANFARRLRAIGRGKFNAMEGRPADFELRGQQEINMHEFSIAVGKDMRRRIVDPVIYKIAKRANYVVDNEENIRMVSDFLEQDHISAAGNRAENLVEVNGERVLKRVLKTTVEEAFDKFVIERQAEELCISSFRYIISKHLKHICLPSPRMLAECECRYCFDQGSKSTIRI